MTKDSVFTPNQYAYAAGDSVNYVDPSGNIPILLAVMLAGAFAGAAVYAYESIKNDSFTWTGLGTAFFKEGSLAAVGAGVGNVLAKVAGKVVGGAASKVVSQGSGGVSSKAVSQSAGKAVGTGRAANKLQPDSSAIGAHTTFKRNPSTGEITNYRTWEPNPRNPLGFDNVKGYDGIGTPHTNKVTKQPLMPHIHDKTVPGGVRMPKFWEIPRGR